MPSNSAALTAHRQFMFRARCATLCSPPPPAERGGGLVCWLEALRALLAFPPLGDVVFTANSGHELGHLGLDEFMSRRLGWERPVAGGGALWVHFGANLG